MPRAKSTTPQTRQAEREIIVTLRLPRELHAKLLPPGAEHGHLTREVRDRLEKSFEVPEMVADDWRTLALSKAAADLQRRYGRRWFEDAMAYEAYRIFVESWLKGHKPEGEPKFELHAEGAYSKAPHPSPLTAEQIANELFIARIL